MRKGHTVNDFIEGVKINPDMNNRVEGPHIDLITDLRTDIGGVEKVRVNPAGEVISGETQVGPITMKW
ncbi:hypothetical protein ACFL41_00205 [Gemmatimonadota bacterium]